MKVKDSGSESDLIEVRLVGEVSLSPVECRSLLDALRHSILSSNLVMRVKGGDWVKVASGPANADIVRIDSIMAVPEGRRIAYAPDFPNFAPSNLGPL